MQFRVVLFGVAALSVLLPVAGQTDTPKPFPQFESRRVKPPEPGTKRRITIQIESQPEEPEPAPTAEQPVEKPLPDRESPGKHAWFWNHISPDLADSRPGRLRDALVALNTAGSISTPRLEALQEVAGDRAAPILTSTVGTVVSPALVLAVIWVESNGRADAVSPAGATGLMQLMPATATRFGVTDRLVADDNIAGGVKYLNWLMHEFDGDPILALAGYNAGEGAVRSHGGVPPYAETRDYVPKVLAAYQVARGLCVTPPELISDGCVFVTAK